MKLSLNFLERAYMVVMIALMILIVFTPLLINDKIFIFDEEVAETIISALLFGLGITIYFLYRKELNRRQKNLDQTLNYIGNLNVQVSNIKAVFNSIKKYPESKNDFKLIMKFLAGKALGIVGSEWILFRIVEIESQKTLGEQFQARGKVAMVKHEVSNKELVKYKACQGCTVIVSDQENFDMQAYCVIPKERVREEEEILIKAIVNNLAMTYLIFTSSHYREAQERTKKNGNGENQK